MTRQPESRIVPQEQSGERNRFFCRGHDDKQHRWRKLPRRNEFLKAMSGYLTRQRA